MNDWSPVERHWFASEDGKYFGQNHIVNARVWNSSGKMK